MKKPKQLRTQTPGKIILSGEHAVVYGNPALAMAIDCYLNIQLSAIESTPKLSITLNDFAENISLNWQQLGQLQQKIDQRYQQFTGHQQGITSVIQQPYQLIAYTVAALFTETGHDYSQFTDGLHLEFQSDIPIGCGMGSSAASIIGTITILCNYFNITLEPQTCYQLAHRIENLQHGRSSGIDIRLAQHGGCIKFKQGEIASRPLPQWPMQLINTGNPESSTGECVSHSQPLLQDSTLLQQFANTTEQFDQSLLTNDLITMGQMLRHNHRLLTDLGVVSNKVQQFIADIEQLGGNAKICGAGSVTGDACGIVLVNTTADLTSLCQQYDYQIMPIKATANSDNLVIAGNQELNL